MVGLAALSNPARVLAGVCVGVPVGMAAERVLMTTPMSELQPAPKTSPHGQMHACMANPPKVRALVEVNSLDWHAAEKSLQVRLQALEKA
eukprot:gene3502-3960_t